MMSSPPEDKPTYAQIAAIPPTLGDENENNEAKSNGEPDQKEKNVTGLGGAHFSKPKERDETTGGDDNYNKPTNSAKPASGSISFTGSGGSSEPEIINVEPPIPPPVDKMPKKPEPEPAKPEPGKKEEPAIVDNMAGDFAPLKHTTMLTKNRKTGQKKGSSPQKSGSDDTELEIVDSETERSRRRRNWMLIAGAGVAIATVVGTVVWKWTRKHK